VLISYGAPSYLGAKTPVDDAALGFSWHLYCPVPDSKLLPLGQITCSILNSLVYNQAKSGAARLGAASLVTEFGATDDPDEITRSTTLFDAQLLGWMYWAYKYWNDPTTSGGNTQSLFTDDADLTTVKTAKLKLLERSYPQFTAGIPEALSFDAESGAFSYRYTPRAATGPTEIYLPLALHYPNGYTVTVSGAQITSAAGAGRLILQNLADATEVSVSVSAR
ncbi:MAG: endoglycoceramidase, partial [Nevskia sp.]|nr:endoglycoceramidase [Nevskia sp.]